VLRALEKKDDQSWRTHHVATIRKVRNRLSNISLRCKGLVADDGATSDLPFGSFQDRTVYVIDVAGLEEDAQDLIFARVVTKLREHLEKRDLGVQHVVVFVECGQECFDLGARCGVELHRVLRDPNQVRRSHTPTARRQGFRNRVEISRFGDETEQAFFSGLDLLCASFDGGLFGVLAIAEHAQGLRKAVPAQAEPVASRAWGIHPLRSVAIVAGLLKRF